MQVEGLIIIVFFFRGFFCCCSFKARGLSLRALKRSLGGTLLSVCKLPGFLNPEQSWGWGGGYCVLLRGSTWLCLAYSRCSISSWNECFFSTLSRAAWTIVAQPICVTLEPCGTSGVGWERHCQLTRKGSFRLLFFPVEKDQIFKITLGKFKKFEFTAEKTASQN